MTAPSILLYVQHLLGIGHLQRTSVLARALVKAGLDVNVVSGGDEVPFIDFSGATFFQLPVIRVADASFGQLVDGQDLPIEGAYKEQRKDQLLSIFDLVKPAALITELYPFGRRQFRFELVPLLEAAQTASPRPRIISSMRDILVEMDAPHREAEMMEIANKFFDNILIHGDPAVAPLEQTFPRYDEIKDKVFYTGYVVDSETTTAPRGDQGNGEVIVSTGSGAVGEVILDAALKAKDKSSLNHLPWRFLAGHRFDEAAFQNLKACAGDGVIIERSRDDFKTLLKNCRLSISQGGYNTTMEILAARTNAIIIPFTQGQSEQSLRARLLAERGLVQQIPEDELTEENLLQAIDRSQHRDRLLNSGVNLDGATETARQVKEWTGGP